jgi:hypothetical protein
MKNALILLACLLTPLAHASSRDTTCGNADGSVRLEGPGMRESYVMITEKNWDTGETTQIRDDWNSEAPLFQVARGEETILRQEGNKAPVCHNGLKGGWSRTIAYKQIRITKTDGSDFSRNTLGVSRDLKAVEADLVCETVTSWLAPCSQ